MIKFIFTIYRCFVWPVLGGECRFYPTCSHYSEMAIEKKGWGVGLLLTIKRLLKCQPFHPGGYDPL